MFDRLNAHQQPCLDDFSEMVRNDCWQKFCDDMRSMFLARPVFEFSRCSWEQGWNVKFKKGAKTLCTLYPREHYFTVMVVIGQKEKKHLETIFSTLGPALQQIYHETKEGNGQRWLMIDCEDDDSRIEDVKRLIALRAMK